MNENWMEAYQNRRLCDIIMPGSHDAGTIAGKVDVSLIVPARAAVTQNLSFIEQLNIGTRFFDLRLKLIDQKVVAHHTTLGLGAFGQDSIDINLRAIATWCRNHPTEIVIIRISHTDKNTNIGRIIAENTNVNNQSVLSKATGNLATKTLTEIKQGGNLVCILENREFSNAINQRNGIHGFYKYPVPENVSGICTCGQYSSTHSISEVISNGLLGQINHANHSQNDHLFQLYWQKTYMNIYSKGIEAGTKKASSETTKRGITTRHGGTHANIDFMIHIMQSLGEHNGTTFGGKNYDEKISSQLSAKWRLFSTHEIRVTMLPNIISYDFVNDETNQTIIALNNPAVQQHVIE